MLTTDYTKCFHEKGKSNLYDVAVEKTDIYTNEKYYIGQITKKTLSELQRTHPDMQLIDYSEFEKIHDNAYISAPQRTTEERFYDAFECLPPIQKNSKQGDIIFAMCEYLSGSITTIYAKINGEYWSLNDQVRIPSDEIYKKIEAAKIALNN